MYIEHNKMFERSQIASCISNKVQELIILPTEKCNFRCTYCYEDFEIGKMSQTTQTAIKRFIENRSNDLSRLNLNWFGGEPLLAKDVILEIGQFAQDLAEEKGFELTGNFTTNGYLLDSELFGQLLEINHSEFQITLDGLNEEHDRTRRRADGEGTFETIWNNLLFCQKLDQDFHIQLRIHITHRNFDSLKALCKEIGKHFGADKRFSVNFQHVRDMGGEGGKTVTKVSRDDYLNKSKLLSEVIKDNSRKSEHWNDRFAEVETDSEGTFEKSESYICYAAKPNSLLIRANGKIGKCTVALDDERNDLGYLSEDGKVIINQTKLKGFTRGFSTLSLSEMACPMESFPSLINEKIISKEQLILKSKI